LEVQPLGPAWVLSDRYRIGTHYLDWRITEAASTLIPSVQTHGFECTVAVASLDQTEARLRERGARIVLERSTIPQVGHLLFFEDPGGNFVGAMEFDRASE
jgi:predicted enzyme related to lactoylglutathione lyase